MPNCDICEIEFTPPPVPGLEDCIEGHVCEACLEPSELPNNLQDAVQELLILMDADIYYAAADYEDWGLQASIDNLFALRTHIQRLLDREDVDICDECRMPVEEDDGLSCPDGAYICRRCFDAGLH